MSAPGDGRRRVAVIGAGVAGLTSAYLLQRTADVTLFEAEPRLGGHAHTHDVGETAVDTGFIVHNVETYPFLLRLFAELGVATQRTEMSMSVQCAGCGLQYAGARGPAGVFAQPKNVVQPAFLRMLAQVPRFHAQARALLGTEPDGSEPTLGEFLAKHQFGRYFTEHFAVPLVSAVWSCAADVATDYPARYLFTFLANHRMLNVTRNAGWRTVTGGSRRYVEALAARLSAVLTSAAVKTVQRHAGGVTVRDATDRTYEFDAVVIATHADQALDLLPETTATEKSVLAAFRYSTNLTVLHGDDSVLPSRRRAQASWNVSLPSCRPTGAPVRISYDMNRLQGIAAQNRLIVTLNPVEEPAPHSVFATMHYEHPVYTPEALAAQRHLPGLNTPVIAFAGAYHGWGFHEDGCRSGAAAAAVLGAPW